MQRSTLAPLLVAISIAVAAPALAAKGGNGNGGGSGGDNGGGGSSQPVSGPTSDIQLASVNGTSLSAAALAPKYGDTVGFSTTVEKLAGWENPVVAVQCYQDVNGDGKVETDMFGPDIVYVAPLGSPDRSYALGGGTSTSLWASRGGGAATCRADLDAYGWTNQGQSIRVLDSTEFHVSG